MNELLRDLYQDVILDHGKRPRNFKALNDATHHLEGNNPLCGDQLTIYLKIDDQELIEDISFEGHGCAISMASASLLTEALRGKSIAHAKHLFNAFHDLVTMDTGSQADDDTLGKLHILAGVKNFPVRVKCATLAWHTLIGALQNQQQAVTTE